MMTSTTTTTATPTTLATPSLITSASERVQTRQRFYRFCVNMQHAKKREEHLFRGFRFQHFTVPNSDDFIEGAGMGPGHAKAIRRHETQGFKLFDGAKII